MAEDIKEISLKDRVSALIELIIKLARQTIFYHPKVIKPIFQYILQTVKLKP